MAVPLETFSNSRLPTVTNANLKQSRSVARTRSLGYAVLHSGYRVLLLAQLNKHRPRT